jgi:hypothetical protein
MAVIELAGPNRFVGAELTGAATFEKVPCVCRRNAK